MEGQIQGRWNILHLLEGVDHGGHYYADAKDTVRSTVFQNGLTRKQEPEHAT